MNKWENWQFHSQSTMSRLPSFERCKCYRQGTFVKLSLNDDSCAYQRLIKTYSLIITIDTSKFRSHFSLDFAEWSIDSSPLCVNLLHISMPFPTESRNNRSIGMYLVSITNLNVSVSSVQFKMIATGHKLWK